MNYQQAWDRVVSDTDPPRAFRDHFAPLATTNECMDILAAISARVDCANIVEEPQDHLYPHSLVFLFEHAEMLSGCPPLNDAPPHLPESYRRAIGIHNGMSFPDDRGYYFAGFYNGEVASNYNEDFWSTDGNDSSIDPTVLECPIEHQSNFVLWHPKVKTIEGEPALAVLDHENGELAHPLTTEFGVGGVFLRLIANSILGADPRYQEFHL